MKYDVIVAHSLQKLADKANEAIQEGWKPVGSHQVITIHKEVRYHGQQTHFRNEYSQTMIKE